jgi:thiamine transport system permease protein
MAERARPLSLGAAAGWLATAGLLLLTVGTTAAVLVRAGAAPRPGPGDWAAVQFTALQAAASALISAALAVPVSRALVRRIFPGRGALITLMGAPFLLPGLVAVIGILEVFGRAGWISRAIAPLGLAPLQIYGPAGIILAHVFFNLPLAVRLILQGWHDIPAERFRLAASLGFGPRDVARLLEWPMLRTTLPGTILTIFLICLTSFVVALTLGGGPRATTVELAIYQAFRFEFDPARAAMLGAVQFALCLCATLATMRFAAGAGFGAGLDRPIRIIVAQAAGARIHDVAILLMVTAFLSAPLLAVVLAGLPYLFDMPASLALAALRSLIMAVASSALALGIALALAHVALRAGPAGKLAEVTGMLSLSASPLVMGTGLFLLLRPLIDPTAVALPATVAVNAAMAVPFVLRILLPGLREIQAGYGRLSDSLGVTGWPRLRLVTLPRLRRPLGFAAGLAAALAMGDLGVIALFGDPDRATLPLEVFRLMGAYRTNVAAAGAVVLLVLSFTLFWICDRWGRNART